MNRFLALLISVHSALMVSGKDRDSLRKMLAFTNEDTGKVKIINALGFSYAWSDADTSIMYAQQAMDLAEKIHFDYGRCEIASYYVRRFNNYRKLLPGVGQRI